MTVLHVHLRGTIVVPYEGNSVVARQTDREAARLFTLPGMEVRPGIVHLLRPLGCIECRKDSSELSYPLSVQTLRLAPGPVVPQRLVSQCSQSRADGERPRQTCQVAPYNSTRAHVPRRHRELVVAHDDKTPVNSDSKLVRLRGPDRPTALTGGWLADGLP